MSQTITVAPTATIPYWVGETKNNKFQEGQPAIVFLPGIGERVADDNYQLAMTTPKGTDAATQTVNRWISSYFPAGADQYGYNIVTVAPLWEYEFGEIVYAIRHAREVLKASKVILVGNSLGMFGIAREAGKRPSFLESIDGIIGFVMGAGEISTTAPNIAKAGVPVWLLTAENDTVSGTTPWATINLHSNLLKNGGHSWLTVIRGDQFDAKTAHQIIGYVVSAWGELGKKTIGLDSPLITTGIPLGKSYPNIITMPSLSIHKWIMATSKSVPLSPMNILDSRTGEIPLPTTTSTTSTTSTTQAPIKKRLTRYVTSSDGTPYGMQVQIFYLGEDGKQYDRVIKAPTGDRIKGVDVNLDTLQVSIDLEKGESVKIDRNII